MAFDPITMLTLTIAIAAAAALYLLLEWRGARDRSLLYWSGGFASITVGSSLALLRSQGYFFIGVWFANGLLVFAHWLFLLGVMRFVGRRPSRGWWALPLGWCLLLALPQASASALYMVTNSLLVGGLALRASQLLRLDAEHASLGTRQLHYTLLFHGLFYLGKVVLTLMPNALIDLASFRGVVIRVSLVEGVMAILLIALSMTGTVRYRRERQIEHLAERDPLTGLFNRRAFEARAPAHLADVAVGRPGALLLLDVDHFKPVNDLHGHAAGDRLLMMLGELIQTALPDKSLCARLGGDEFAILLVDTDQAQVLALAEILRQRFQATTAQSFATPDAVTLSLGAVMLHQPQTDLAALIERGDIALYAAKRGGRNGLRVSKPAAEVTSAPGYSAPSAIARANVGDSGKRGSSVA